MLKKRGQTWSLETYLAIAVFLIAVIFFYGLTTVSNYKTNINVEVEEVGRALMKGDQLKDGVLSDTELDYLISLNCTGLKQLFNVDQDICIYLKDSNGNLFTRGNKTIYGIGCPGFNISGQKCGTIK